MGFNKGRTTMKKIWLLLAALLAYAGIAFAAINVNTASKEQLEALDGIGPVKAQAIIDYRTKNGPFKSLEDLKKVSGIGDATYDKIRKDVSLTGATTVPAAEKKADAKPAAAPAAPAPAAKKADAKPAAAPAAPAPAAEKKEAAKPAKTADEKKADAKKEKEAKAEAKKAKEAEAKKEKEAKAEAKKEEAKKKADAKKADAKKDEPKKDEKKADAKKEEEKKK
jgi:competence protein ComEA